MARYRKIETRIWNDCKFNSLTDDAKLLLFFLLTHPHLTSIGAMRTSSEGLAGELKWNAGKLQQALNEVLSKGIVKYDEKALFLWLPNFLKYNPPESPNVVKSWENALDNLPECNLKCELMYRAKILLNSFSLAFQEALPKGFGKSKPNQEQEHEQEQDHKQDQEPNNINNNNEQNSKIEIENNQTEINCLNQYDKNTSVNQLAAVTHIPLMDNTEYPITENLIAEWKNLFPSIDILQELNNIRGWNLSNPSKRKTQSNILTHINAWLTKSQKNHIPSQASLIQQLPRITSMGNNLSEQNKSIARLWTQLSSKIINNEGNNDSD